MNKRVVNLRTVRKQRDRAEKKASGDQNAARSRRDKAEKAFTRLEASRQERTLDGHKRTPNQSDDDDG